MKKILFLLAAVSLTLTSCLKEDETYKRYQPVMPGMQIFDGAITQQRIASQPLDQMMRLAVLLAEADVQEKGIEDLPTMTVKDGEKTLIVQDQLFRRKTTISKTESGDYTLVLEPESSGYYTSVGTITIKTNGVPLLENTDSEHPWEVILPAGFIVRKSANYSPTGFQDVLLEGKALIYRLGGFYSLQIQNMKAYVKETSSVYSDWNGLFELTPPTGGESLAFSTCMNKKFKLDGVASGQTCIPFNGQTGAEMSYEVKNGIYFGPLQCVDGTEIAQLTGYNDYDASSYPASKVEMIWKLSSDERSYSRTINYNGYSVVD